MKEVLISLFHLLTGDLRSHMQFDLTPGETDSRVRLAVSPGVKSNCMPEKIVTILAEI